MTEADKIEITLPFKLEQTCMACPEQYDVLLAGRIVGYLRLRHGWFYASCPTAGGEIVYQADMEESDGSFSEAEAAWHIPRALLAVYWWLQKHGDEV